MASRLSGQYRIEIFLANPRSRLEHKENQTKYRKMTRKSGSHVLIIERGLYSGSQGYSWKRAGTLLCVRGHCNQCPFWISLVFWATELDARLSSSICQPASINKSSSGNRARYGFIEVDISTGLDELIDLGKPSSICRYRARIVEDGEARTPTFPGGQVECYRAR